MAVTTTKTNKPINPRGNDQSPKGYNRAELYTGKALDFDGVNDYVDLDGFTMAGNVATIVFQAKFSNGAYLFDINNQRFVVLNNTTNGLSVYNSNAWTYYGETIRGEIGFYAIVSDGTTQRAYFNGVQLGEDKTIVAIDWDSITEMALGSNNNGTGSFFSGQIAGFKIFNTALTAAQVADLYNNPEKIVPTGVADSALKLYLPMMEGAGTTAYDGSGNGNHGTISGATWTHGIGAPVSQSAVIDWNKGGNLFTYSEDFSQTAWTKDALTLTANDTTAPDGSNTAEKIEASIVNAYIQQTKSGLDTSASYTLSIWARTDSGTADFQIGNLDVSNYVTKTATSEWQRFEVTQTPSATTRYPRIFRTSTSDAVTIYLWGAQLEKVSSAGAYIPNHTGTQITSDVLLPAGLTSGRDITGVNLFENVRKQGALNLDGNSWAEVHDNASLDITDAITLEAWVYWDANTNRGILGRWITGTNERCYLLYKANSTNISMYVSSDGTNTNQDYVSSNTTISNGWNHLVGTYDGTKLYAYVNGVLKNSKTTSVASITSTSDNIEIARYNADSSTAVTDQIAQPRIYNRALTAEEIERNFTAGKYTYNND